MVRTCYGLLMSPGGIFGIRHRHYSTWGRRVNFLPQVFGEEIVTKTNLIVFVLTFLLLVSCGPYGHWSSYSHWHTGCPDFPTREEVENVLKEHQGIIEELKEEGLIWSADINECPQGAFITLLHNSEGQKASVLKILDREGARTQGLNRFFGIPFRFLNV